MSDQPFTRDAIKGAIRTVLCMKQRALKRGVNGLPAFQAMANEETRLRDLHYQLCLKDYRAGKLGIHEDWSVTA